MPIFTKRVNGRLFEFILINATEIPEELMDPEQRIFLFAPGSIENLNSVGTNIC